MKRILLFAVLMMVQLGFGQSPYTSVGSGNWDDDATWSGTGVPGVGDVVNIANGHTITVTANAAATSVIFVGSSATLTINAGFKLDVTNSVILNSNNTVDTVALLSGAGTLNCASVAVGIPGVPSVNTATILTSTLGNFNVSGDLVLVSRWNTTINNASFRLEAGILNVDGRITSANQDAAVTSTFTMATGVQTGILLLSNASPFGLSTTGTNVITLNGTGSTVNYDGLNNQTVRPAIYNNLTLSGSGTKTNTSVAVNGMLSMEGTATATVAPTYGTNATLQYNTTIDRSAGVEWPSTFSGSGGVVVKNIGDITLNTAKTISNNFSIETSAKVNLGAFTHFSNGLTLGGSIKSFGSWGSSTSVAPNTDDTFFAATTGIINVSSSTCVSNLITNGNFTNAATGNNQAVGWTFTPTKGTYVETYPENTYFGTGNGGYTAELDAGASLRQAVTVVPGVSYTLSFIYARRSGPQAPSPSGVTIAVIGGTSGASSLALSTSSLTPEIGAFTFTPTSASITLDFYNHLATNQTYGTIIDNIVLVPTSQVTPFATTIPKGNFNTLLSCAGTPVQLDVDNVPSSGVTYSWTGSTGATFSATNIKNPIVTFTNTGPPILKEVTVTVTTAAGCISTSTTYVNLNSTNGPTITTAATPAVVAAVCQSSSAQTTTMAYTATTNSPTSYRIDWDTLVDQGSTAFTFVATGGNLNTIVVPAGTPAGTYTGTLIITNASCSATRAITMTINPLPSAPTIGTITQPTCALATGSVALSGLPSSGTWTITATPATGALTGLTGTNVDNTTIGGLTANTSYTFVVNYGTCSSTASTAAVINGVPATATWNGSAWSGTTPAGSNPLLTQPIIFNGNYTSTGDINGCSCTVTSGNVLIKDGHTMTITNAVNVTNNATTSLVFENNASLYQTTNATNTGAIEYRRISKPMKNFDYTYWSSPVTGQTAKLLSPNTLADKYFTFNPSLGWVFNDGVMTPGVGFIIRTPKPGIYGAPYPETVVMPYEQPVAFKGVPNNGDVTFDVKADEYNLVGNPYPSALNATKFMQDNSAIIYGALYFWTHNTAIQQSGSNYIYVAEDYATFNITGGTATGPAPNPGLNNNIPSGFIAAGQSFFVGSQTGIPANSKFIFKNSQREVGNNAQFFKQVSTKKTTTVEKNRVWLNLTNSGGAFKQLLVGYIEGATNDWDNLYDGPTFDGQEFVDFYSVNKGQNLTIQGRALPFVDTDVVPLGYRSTIAGSFDISIDNRDGQLATQSIWLEDKKTNTIHDLIKGKYTFTAINGVENDRFILKYNNTNKTLETDENVLADKAIIVSVKNKKITITSSAEAITQVQVFDLLGRKVYDNSKIHAQEWSISTLPSSEQALIVKTTLANGAISSKKIIY